MTALAYRKKMDSQPDSGVRETSEIRRNPPARTFSTRFLERMMDTVSSIRSIADTAKASMRSTHSVIDEMEKTPTPPDVVFAQYKPKPDGAAVFRLKK